MFSASDALSLEVAKGLIVRTSVAPNRQSEWPCRIAFRFRACSEPCGPDTGAVAALVESPWGPTMPQSAMRRSSPHDPCPRMAFSLLFLARANGKWMNWDRKYTRPSPIGWGPLAHLLDCGPMGLLHDQAARGQDGWRCSLYPILACATSTLRRIFPLPFGVFFALCST